MPLSNLKVDVRLSLRSLLRNPSFAAVAVLTLALGIGLTTATFTVVDALFIRSLPVENPDELVALEGVDVRGTYSTFSYPTFESLPEKRGILTV